MNPLFFIFALLFFIALCGASLNFVLYPLAVLVANLTRGRGRLIQSTLEPTVSILIVVRNGEALITDKILNSLALVYPEGKREVIVYSDGSTDRTDELARLFSDKGVRLISPGRHLGKIRGLNLAAATCTGEVIVFSDVDAILSPNALAKLVRHFGDPEVGGVCGQRIIAKAGVELSEAQNSYIRADSLIKFLESRTGSITSNDGKLYAIRRKLFQPIADGVTDDLYALLSIIRQGRRFVFEPEARATIRTPSKDRAHEIERRRRIVAQSLRGLWLMREVLNPFHFGAISIKILVNKVLRRLLPASLIMLFLSSALLIQYSKAFGACFTVQAAFYGLALSYPAVSSGRIPGLKMAKKIASVAFYFCLGNYGTLLGFIDFIMGRSPNKWEPKKADK